MAYENLCMNCMKVKGNGEQCPHCHFHNDSLQLPPFLPMRTFLGGHYLVGAVLDSNGDGTTYMGFDTESEKPVTIREFLPDTIAKRSSDSNQLFVRESREKQYAALKDSFMDLYGKLCNMNGLSALISVVDIFEENNTAYAVYEYAEGAQSLRDYLLSIKGGYLSWKEARVMFMPVLSTIATLHSNGIIHRGISPQTLLIYPDRKIRISGFSIPECRTVNSGLTTEVFPGYTPVEQLGVQTAAGPWTDIYSFAAVLYRALIARAPIDAMIRLENDEMMIPAEFAEKLPSYVVNGLVNALQVLPEDRTRNIDRFRAELSASQVAEFASEYEEEEKARKRRMYAETAAGYAGGASIDDEPTRPISSPSQADVNMYSPDDYPQKKSHKGLIAVIVILLAAAIAAACFFLFRSGGPLNSPGFSAPVESSEEANTVEVPDFVGKSITAVQNSDYSNFEIRTKSESSDTVPKGEIMEQSIKAGTKVDEGTEIVLTVSSGPSQITVPSGLEGMTVNQATAALQKAGFTVSTTTRTNDGQHTSGTVASVSLPSGKACDRGTNVTLIIWGEVQVTDPPTASTTDPIEDIKSNVSSQFDDLMPGAGEDPGN